MDQAIDETPDYASSAYATWGAYARIPAYSFSKTRVELADFPMKADFRRARVLPAKLQRFAGKCRRTAD